MWPLITSPKGRLSRPGRRAAKLWQSGFGIVVMQLIAEEQLIGILPVAAPLRPASRLHLKLARRGSLWILKVIRSPGRKSITPAPLATPQLERDCGCVLASRTALRWRRTHNTDSTSLSLHREEIFSKHGAPTPTYIAEERHTMAVRMARPIIR